MALARVKTWASEILTPTDLNAEIDNILNNALSLISPLTGNLDLGSNTLLGNAGTIGIQISAGGLVRINESTNANMTVGLTINQGANDNQILALKSSDVATGLTTATDVLDVETDDYLVIGKRNATLGGTVFEVMAEDDAALATVFGLNAYGGTPTTADITSSTGLINFFAGEHDGANTLVNASANANLFTVQSYSGGAITTRLLLKADDGELHLGNTTLVALDSDDDPQYVRALIMERTNGEGVVQDDYYKRSYDYEALHRIGVVGPKDCQGEYLIRVQPYLGLHDMAIWQLYVKHMELKGQLTERLENIERALLESPC